MHGTDGTGPARKKRPARNPTSRLRFLKKCGIQTTRIGLSDQCHTKPNSFRMLQPVLTVVVGTRLTRLTIQDEVSSLAQVELSFLFFLTAVLLYL